MPKSKLEIIHQPGAANVILVRKCPWCGKEVRKEMPVDEFNAGVTAWENGACVQNAFPKADASMREMLLTGICDPCWDNM